ncbi:MAG: DUF1987 domain-containing protein [Salinivirgaceae bacterium]|nr:DUF1987 domain-containing protein [Salinivirgaceae bacterium]
MEPLYIKSATTTPEVAFDGNTGELLIEGVSRPEDVLSFYKPVFDWITEYVKNPSAETNLIFKLKYHNSASAKIVCRIMNMFDPLYKKGGKVKIKWYYNEADEDILEAGEDYQALVGIPFEIIKI